MSDSVRVRRWTAVAMVAAVAPLLAGVVVGPVRASAADPAPGGGGASAGAAEVLVGELRQVGGSAVVVERSPETGAVAWLGGSRGAPLTADATADHGGAARGFVDRYGPLFGVDEPGEALVETGRRSVPGGGTAVRFVQRYAGLVVFGPGVRCRWGPSWWSTTRW